MTGTHLTSGMLLLWLVVSVTVATSIIFFADTESRGIYAEIIVTAAVTVAAALAIILAYRQVRYNRPHSKMYLSLAAGLVLWFCADIVWASYELVFHTVAPIPSLSDILWLAGYPFFAYNLFATYHEFRSKFNKRVLVASIIGNAILLTYLILFTISLSDFSTQKNIGMFAVIIAYPIMNAILTIPALPILVGLWKEKSWSIPWTFKSLSLFCIVVTDSWFAFIIISRLYDQVWISSILFGVEYLILASGLVWFNKFLIIYKTQDMLHTHSGHHPGSTTTTPTPANTVFIGKNTTKIRYLQVLAAVILVGGIISHGFMTSMATGSTEHILPEGHNGDILVMGALLPLTGALSSYGEEAAVALKIAVKDINEHFAASGSTKRIGLIIEDTKTDPSLALEKLGTLKSKGIEIVIGPATSAEVAAVKQYADKNDILIVSVSSTAPDLAIPEDSVFRFVPDDTRQAEVLAKQIWDDEIRVIIPMWRTDVFGNNLQKLMKDNFENLGGHVVDGVGYDPLVGDFSSSLHRINFIVWEQNLRSLVEKVNDAKTQYGDDRVGVYIISFDEIVPILIQAERHPTLASVKWYGSDGSAQVAGVVKNSDAASFAVKTNFLNPIYGVEQTESFKELEARITDEIGRKPRSYAETAYDALWVATLTLDNYYPDEAGIKDNTSLRDIFLQTANSYVGVTGNIELNEAGDRRSGSYDLWAVRAATHDDNDDHASFLWSSVITYRIQ